MSGQKLEYGLGDGLDQMTNSEACYSSRAHIQTPKRFIECMCFLECDIDSGSI